ncbi:MAG TPA: hypothetical protein DCW35_08930 [Polynucleobacter sp.]|nr:hypothetical protein [Polynucleobacter sp.]
MMHAYFSSNFKKQIRTICMAVLLLSCLQGRQWLGVLHSISHSRSQVHELTNTVQSDCQLLINHSSDVCHLFDALSLAGFIPSLFIDNIALNNFVVDSSHASYQFISLTSLETYQSKALPQTYFCKSRRQPVRGTGDQFIYAMSLSVRAEGFSNEV